MRAERVSPSFKNLRNFHRHIEVNLASTGATESGLNASLSNGVLDCCVFGEIVAENYWNESSLSVFDTGSFTAYVALNKAEVKSVRFWINSYGGSMNAMMMSVAVLNFFAIPYEVNVLGNCFSAATYPLIGASVGKRRAANTATFLIHSVMTSAFGNAVELKAIAQELESLDANLLRLYGEKTGKDFSKYFKGENIFISAQEALELGLIDEIVANLGESFGSNTVVENVVDPELAKVQAYIDAIKAKGQ